MEWRKAIKLIVLLGAVMALYTAVLAFAASPALSAFVTGYPALLRQYSLQWWLPWIVLSPLALHATRRFSWTTEERGRFLLKQLCLFALLAGVHALALLAQPDATLRQLLYYLPSDALVYALVVAHETFERMADELKRQRYDSARLNKHLSESRLQTLKMQLNPHFLFNTLNSVAVLVEKQDNEQAREMIGELSKFLRQTLSNSAEKWISLNRELGLVREYLAIEKIRFGRRLVYHEECEPLALGAKVPPMLLQPLFENAIVHGLSEKEGACRLTFECRVHDRRLFILISDNGQGFEAAQDPMHRAGIGLANIQARLREVYGDNYSLELERMAAGGTQVSMKIPAYKDSYF